MSEFKKTEPKEYVELGSLGADLDSDELIAKRANRARIKHFSSALREVNKEVRVPPSALVFTLWLSVLCIRSKAWLAAPVLLAHADVTKNIKYFLMGPKLRLLAVQQV